MTIFDRERQKRAEEERKQAEAAAKQRQAEDARRKQERISRQYLDQSLFPKLLHELESHLCLHITQKSYTHASRIPTLNSDSNYATLTVPYVEKERSQKAELTSQCLELWPTRSYRSTHVSCKEVTRWTLSV